MEPALGCAGSMPESSVGLTPAVDEKKKVNKWSILRLRKQSSFYEEPILLGD